MLAVARVLYCTVPLCVRVLCCCARMFFCAVCVCCAVLCCAVPCARVCLVLCVSAALCVRVCCALCVHCAVCACVLCRVLRRTCRPGSVVAITVSIPESVCAPKPICPIRHY